MARLARVIIPGLPHFITQRASGKRVFFSDGDYALYHAFVAESCAKARVQCVAFVAMPTHVHLILVPKDEDGIRAALAPAHRRYAGAIHNRRNVTGHFWRARFGAVVMDDAYMAEAFRYMMQCPVKAGLAKRPEAWPWSSAKAYLKGTDDGLTNTAPLRKRFPDMRAALAVRPDEESVARLLASESIGRPVGSKSFIERIEKICGRDLAVKKPGPKS
jgi:putative transposase